MGLSLLNEYKGKKISKRSQVQSLPFRVNTNKEFLMLLNPISVFVKSIKNCAKALLVFLVPDDCGKVVFPATLGKRGA